MIGYWRTLAICIALALAACTVTAQNGAVTIAQADPLAGVVGKLAAAALPDLQAAGADATAHADPVAAQCWSGLVPVAQQIQALAPSPAPSATSTATSTPAGLFLTFQEVRDVKATVNQDVLGILTAKGMLGQLRQQINLACGALQVDVTAGLADPFGLVSGPALP